MLIFGVRYEKRYGDRAKPFRREDPTRREPEPTVTPLTVKPQTGYARKNPLAAPQPHRHEQNVFPFGFRSFACSN